MTIHDQQGEKFGLVGNILELNSGYGERVNSLYINILGKSLYMKNEKGEIRHLGDLRIDERKTHLRAHLKENVKVKLNICLKSRSGYLFVGYAHVAVVKMKERKIKGAPKMNLIRVWSNGGRSFYLNRSRQIIFFNSENKNMDGVFARLKVKISIGMIGHYSWYFL